MSDALLSTGAALLLAAVVLAGVGALTLVPFVVTVGLAERRSCGTARWGLASAVSSLVGLGAAAVAVRHGLGLPVAAFGAAATWAAPLAMLLLGTGGGRLAGVRGRHE